MKGLLFWVWEGSSFLFTFFHITGIDPSLAIRITPSVSRHYDAFPKIAIQNGRKNALWE